MQKICEWHYCKKEFAAKRRDRRYCYNNHKNKCDNCGNMYVIKHMKVPGKSCSKMCADILTKKSTESKGITKNCSYCGDSFTALKSTDIYCKKQHTSTCIVCGESFNLTSMTRIAKTCSKKCAADITDFEARNKKSVQTVRIKHGVENVSQIDEIKEKKKMTSLENYGVDNPSKSKEIQKKRESTFLAKYGVDNPLKDQSIQDRIAETNLTKYGAENVFSLSFFQEKAKRSIFEKYGVKNISQLEEFRTKAKATTFEKYGVESVLQLAEVQQKSFEANGKRISKINRYWHNKILHETGVDFTLESRIGQSNIFADLGYQNIVIEINPSITHNSTIHFAHTAGRCSKYKNGELCDKNSHKPLAETYHQKRAIEAEQQGYILLQYFDWYDEDIFVSIVKAKLGLCSNKIFAKRTELREISQRDANRFLKENHLIGATNGQTLCLGLFHNDELIHVQTYGKARMSKNHEWEAIRSCSKLDYVIPGGFSKCDKYFFNKIQPDSVVSYVDLSFSKGETDTKFSGWKIEKTNRPNATWVLVVEDNDKPSYVKDSSVRRVSADRILGFEIGDKYPKHHEDGSKLSNDFVMLSEGYVKVYDAGVRRIGWVHDS